MSTFLDCIKTAVKTGRISDTKGLEAEKFYNEALQDALDAGSEEAVARNIAANSAVERAMKLKGEKRWRRINELRRAHELYTRFSVADNLPKELEKLGRELEVGYRRTLGQAHAVLNETLEEFRPRAAGIVQPVGNLKDVVRAAYGDTSNPAAARMAKEITEAYAFLRKSMNMYGASVPPNPNHRLPQTHDRLKVGRVTKEVWVQDHLNRLDWDLMSYNDRPIPVARREEVLGRVYESIRHAGNNKITPGHTAVEHLAARLSKERFLYYKDADSYLAMQEKYGSGNTFQQTIAAIDSMSRDVATLEKFGPNPTAMKNYLANTVKKQAYELEQKKPVRRGKSETTKADEALAKFDNEYNLHNLLVLNGDENVMAQGMATVRTTVLSSVLSGAYIANLPDLVFMKHNALMHKMPLMGHTRAYLKHFIPNKANRELAIRSGLIAESATSMAMGYQRYFGLMDGSAWARRYADIINRLQLLTPHIQATKWAHGMELMGVFYDHRGKAFSDLPFVNRMRELGLTEKDWELFRHTTPYMQDGARLLRPVDLANAGGNSVQNQIVANKIMDFIQLDGLSAVPTPTNRVRASMGQHIPANTVIGQMARTIGALKSFPVTIMMVQGKDILNAPPGERLLRAAQFFTLLTMAGAFITQARELAYGKDPYDMTTADFWVRSVVNGGSLGLLGDVVADTINMFGNNSAGDTLGGPVTEFFNDSLELTVGNLAQMLEGKDTKAASEAIRFLRSYGPRLWQIRLLLDRMVYDTLLEQADPEAYRRIKRMERRRLREEGRGAWAGRDGEVRLPDLSTAFGGNQ